MTHRNEDYTDDDDFRFDLSQDVQDCLRYSSARHGESLGCGSCGKRTPTLYPCYWAEGLEVGACCLIHEDDEPLCGRVEAIAEAAGSVEQFVGRLKEHLSTCRECGGIPPLNPVRAHAFLSNLSERNQEVA